MARAANPRRRAPRRCNPGVRQLRPRRGAGGLGTRVAAPNPGGVRATPPAGRPFAPAPLQPPPHSLLAPTPSPFHLQVLVISGPLTAAFFATAPARVAAAHPQLAACAPATLPQLLPRLLAASALPLAFGIVLVGQGRFLNPLAMNPLSHPAADRVVSRYLQNTLEQVGGRDLATWSIPCMPAACDSTFKTHSSRWAC